MSDKTPMLYDLEFEGPDGTDKVRFRIVAMNVERAIESAKSRMEPWQMAYECRTMNTLSVVDVIDLEPNKEDKNG